MISPDGSDDEKIRFRPPSCVFSIIEGANCFRVLLNFTNIKLEFYFKSKNISKYTHRIVLFVGLYF